MFSTTCSGIQWYIVRFHACSKAHMSCKEFADSHAAKHHALQAMPAVLGIEKYRHYSHT